MLKYIEHYLSRFNHHKRPSLFHLTAFFRQFATLLSAGVPIIQACNILERNQANQTLQQITRKIKHELQAGKTLCYALEQHPQLFNNLLCQLVRISEFTGRLDNMLLLITAYLEKQLAFRRQVKQALLYPCIVATIGSIITLGMLIFVVPHFAELFQDIPGKLPAITLCIFILANGIRAYGWLIPFSLILLGLTLYRSNRLLFWLNLLRQHAIQLPIIHAYWRQITLAHFTHTLAVTLNAGVNLPEALTLAAGATTNPPFQQLMILIRQRIQAGFQLHHAMASLTYFPPLLVDMIKVGEESGTLNHMLTKTAAFFEADVERSLSTLSQLLEPLIMLVLGVLIGGLVISLYLPIFKLGSTI